MSSPKMTRMLGFLLFAIARSPISLRSGTQPRAPGLPVEVLANSVLDPVIQQVSRTKLTDQPRATAHRARQRTRIGRSSQICWMKLGRRAAQLSALLCSEQNTDA